MNRFQTFTMLIHRITKCIQKIKTAEMKRFGLKSVHVSCLYSLYEQQRPITFKELCTLCEVDKALISRALEDLKKKGYIYLDLEQEKKYRSLISLTREGNEIGQYIEERIQFFLEEAGRGLTAEERASLYTSLELISNQLEKSARRRKEDD